ncbi:toll-like receptor 4 [Haliotis asinina]|uniref:toll-like receptor 4 n=1 Tax=Haliotis asinina TaxID=109174 RepID=UPI003531A142
MAMRFSFLIQLSIKICFVCASSNICSPCECSSLSQEGCIFMDCSSRNLSKLPAFIPNSTCRLNLQNNLIETLVNDSFKELKNITSLDVSFNSMFELQGTSFAGLSKLEYLDLSSNNISFNATAETVFSPLQRLRSLNISNNTYPMYPRELLGSLGSLHSLTMDVLVTLTAVMLFTSVVLSGICYRYRWNLIYFFYATKLKHKRNTRTGDDSYDFDAYVSYADVDFDFVRNMVNKMENLLGTRLYIRDRDSIPGAPIAENIIDGIRRSRRTVLVLSRAFLRKKWCRNELHMANMESVSTRRSVMIIIMLEDLPRQHIPPEILYDVQNGSFVDYPQEEAEMDQFWRNLQVAVEV